MSNFVSKYPWAEWLDGEPRLLTRGRHFDCAPRSFINAAHKYGARHELDIGSRILGDVVLLRKMPPKRLRAEAAE